MSLSAHLDFNASPGIFYSGERVLCKAVLTVDFYKPPPLFTSIARTGTIEERSLLCHIFSTKIARRAP
jgi:hypothetical protein